MKSTAIACAIATASLGFGSLSYADGLDRGGRGHDRQGYASRDHRLDHRDGRHTWQDSRYQQRQDYQRHDAQRPHGDHRYQQRHHGQYAYPEQWRSHHGHYAYPEQWRPRQFRRGDHLPYQFRQRQYYVEDWRAHRLYAPPQGYQWIRADNNGDYLLVAIATGLIANLLLSQ